LSSVAVKPDWDGIAMQQEDLKPFSIDVEPLRDAVRVCPSGELDLATVGVLREQVEDLIATGFKRLVLDLGELTYFDSTGIHLVLELIQSSQADGWELALLDGAAPVRRVFDVTGLRDVVPFVERRDASSGRVWR
jgi:anti-anti-sigma factor